MQNKSKEFDSGPVFKLYRDTLRETKRPWLKFRFSENPFAYNIKFIRKSLGWTQAITAQEITKQYNDNIKRDMFSTLEDLHAVNQKLLFTIVSTNRYKLWELGRTKPGLDFLLAIAEVFFIDDLKLFIYTKFTGEEVFRKP